MMWLLRISRWIRNPPSPARVKLVFGVIALCLVLVAVEKLGFWPDWLQVNKLHR